MYERTLAGYDRQSSFGRASLKKKTFLQNGWEKTKSALIQEKYATSKFLTKTKETMSYKMNAIIN